MINQQKNIFLVGLMGAGKTTIGRTLAKRLLLEFHDSDKVIEARTGVNIPTIFEIEGEAGFRLREAQVIADLSRLHGCVVATGGGAVLRPENRENMRQNALVVYLDARPSALWERVRHDRNRPLLMVADPLARLTDLYAERDPLYREVADFVVESSRLSAQAVLHLLMKKFGEQ